MAIFDLLSALASKGTKPEAVSRRRDVLQKALDRLMDLPVESEKDKESSRKTQHAYLDAFQQYNGARSLSELTQAIRSFEKRLKGAK